MTQRGASAAAGPVRMADPALVRLVARFVALAAVLLGGFVWLGARTDVVTNIMSATAAAATALMNLTGVAASNSDALISVSGHQLLIAPDCTGMTVAAVLAALVLAYQLRASSRAIGVFVGVAVVLAANLVRLVAVAHIASAPAMMFVVVHDFLFQVGMIAVGIGVWAAWLSFARARER